MKKLFTIGNIDFYEEDFQDNIEEVRDIIELVADFSENMKIEEIECAGENDCCGKTTKNYISELMGALTEEDDFYSLEEIQQSEESIKKFSKMNLYPFGMQVYKCVNCGKWIVNILEPEEE